MKKLIAYIKSNECLKRSIRTFIQAFLFTLATNYTAYFSGIVNFGSWAEIKPLILSLIASALSAGMAAVMNRNNTVIEEGDTNA